MLSKAPFEFATKENGRSVSDFKFTTATTKHSKREISTRIIKRERKYPSLSPVISSYTQDLLENFLEKICRSEFREEKNLFELGYSLPAASKR